jgi:DNA-binding LytR/AlgR family response regulator
MKEYIPVIKTRESIRVRVEEVLYVEQYLRKTKILTETGSHEVYCKISDYLDYMGDNFLKCHRSLYVNMDNVISMKDQTVYFKNGESILLSRDKYTAAKQRFSRYITCEKKLIFYLFFSCNINHFVV